MFCKRMRRRIHIACVIVCICSCGIKPAENQQRDAEPVYMDTVAVKEPHQAIPNLQPVIDEWASSIQGQAGVIVYDLKNQVCIGSKNSDALFFSASIYKLFVAYEGYLAFQNGLLSPSEKCHANHTQSMCMDAMIRSSESACAQKILAKIGTINVSEKMVSYGMSNTSVKGLTTTAHDVMIFLKRLYESGELTSEHRITFFDSMKNQPDRFRSGLPQGFKDAVVYNKVGWNELKEWHDAAIITLANGHSYVIVVLTKGVGWRKIRSLGNSLNHELLLQQN